MMDKFLWFIKERETIRVKKENGQPKPWTHDPTLQHYRFCNVYREDDKVSRWIFENWIQPYEYHPNLLGAILLARMINWPDTLDEIGYPWIWDKQLFANLIRDRMNRGEKTWTGAYMITAENNGNPKELSVCKTVTQAMAAPWDTDTCYQTWTDLQTLPRIGSFMAAQVVADLKRTHYLGNAVDALTFCAPGPGSQRGLNILLDTPHKEWKQPAFQEEVNKLRDSIPLVIDAQNVQNCLCEFSKYVRGSSRSTYPGV